MDSKTEILALLKKAVNDYNEVYPESFIDYNSLFVGFGLRSHCAGRAYSKWDNYYRIDFNVTLFNDNREEFIKTIYHELAHTKCYQLYPGQDIGHGYQWQEIMIEMGYPPLERHSYDCSSIDKKVRPYIYKCDSCNKEYKLTSIKHNKLIKQPGRYICRCGARIRFINDEDKD